MTTPFNDLLNWLPDGRVQYVRDPDHNKWGVAIYAPGSVAMLHRVAEGMDKTVAAWTAMAMVVARPDKFIGTEQMTENEMAGVPGGVR